MKKKEDKQKKKIEEKKPQKKKESGRNRHNGKLKRREGGRPRSKHDPRAGQAIGNWRHWTTSYSFVL